ncbi:mRNA interferase HicA [Cupriavidus sp. H18C1]|uniref:type II toxin-antitoxin system HicA family toxin n=1 Tax=Cupriavidus sp. H18C1 TaxID=3241601 RepID=UPI003BB860BB
MKQSEFKRWLCRQSATFVDGGKHLKVYLNGRQSTMPRHPGREITEPTRKAILKQLGLA